VALSRPEYGASSRRTWPERIALALPGAFLAVVFGFFFITKTSEAWTARRVSRRSWLSPGIIGDPLPAPERDRTGPRLDGAGVVPGVRGADRQRQPGRGV